MARVQSSSVVIFFRRNPRQIPDAQTRKLTVDAKETEFSGRCDEAKANKNQDNPHGHFTQIAKQVSKITRTKPRWDQTLLSDYPSFNFCDPQFFHELLKHQNNVFLSLNFFQWLHSRYNFVPDQVSCNQLFHLLLDAKASNAAKYFLHVSGFSPDVDALERYIQCLCQGGFVQEALDVLQKFKEAGLCPSIKTWNSALFGCLKTGRIDVVWKLYRDMIELGVVANMDAKTLASLIQAFCSDDKPEEGYQLLQQVLECGFKLRNFTFNRLISGFCKKKMDYGRVSDLLRTMIALNQPPDIITYQEVIQGLCKEKKLSEALRIFNDLKNRGYFPDRVVYTTLIRGLCDIKEVRKARKLWFEMVSKGISPNEHAYNTLILGFLKIDETKEAWKLYQEMCYRGIRETTASCNRMISGFCSNAGAKEAFRLFKQMPQKGVIRNVTSYNILIQGFCKQGMLGEGENILKELLASGLQPKTFCYTCLIKRLCKKGDWEEAIELWKDMKRRGLKQTVSSYDHLITALFEGRQEGLGMELLIATQERKLKLRERTFNRSVKCLIRRNKLDDSLSVLNFMFRSGYSLTKGTCHTMVSKLCKKNGLSPQTCLDKILERE